MPSLRRLDVDTLPLSVRPAIDSRFVRWLPGERHEVPGVRPVGVSELICRRFCRSSL